MGVKNEMKMTRLIAIMLVVSMVITVSSTLLAQAQEDYDYNIFWGFAVTPRGNVWQISTVSPLGTSIFSGRDVNPDTISATIWHYCQNTPEVLHDHTITPKQVVLTDKLVILVFDKATLPKTAEYTVLTGTLNNGETFTATGPGFVLCFIGC